MVDINEEPVEDATETFIIQEEANFEPQKVKNVVVSEPVEALKEEAVEEEEKPTIIYPEGTVPLYEESRPPQQAPPPVSQVRRPPPPNLRRPRPPPPNLRRPPKPPQYLPALSRNAPDQRPPRPPPPPPRGPIRRPPPRPRPPPPPPASNEKPGIIGSIGNWLKCKGTDAVSEVKLQDENFVRQQLDCVLDRGKCDELGATLKRKKILFTLIRIDPC